MEKEAIRSITVFEKSAVLGSEIKIGIFKSLLDFATVYSTA